MPKTGVGDRSGWKGRLEKSSWVDSSRWVDKGDGSGPVEFLEAEPSAYRLSQAQKKPTPSMSSPVAKALGFGAVAVVLIALAIMSRPGDQDPASQLSAEEQILRQREAEAAGLLDEEGSPDAPAVEEESALSGQDDVSEGDVNGEDADASADAVNSAADVDSAVDVNGAGDDGPDALAAGETVELRPIPDLRADLPEDFPGVLFAYGPQESVVSIRRSEVQPVESQLDSEGGQRAGMVQTSASEVAVFSGGQLFSLPIDGGVEQRGLQDGSVHPGDDGFMILLEQDRERLAYVLGGSDETDTDAQEGIVVGNDLTVLGAWSGRVLVYQASKVWLLDGNGGATAVTDGVLLGYDGSYLSMVRCDAPSSCRIEVGTPAQPSLRSVPVPDTLAGRDIELWASTAAVSADGTRLAIVDQRGAVQLPTWIDLDTGVATTKSESVIADSPVAWSPDGRWLAFAFAQDLLVWDTEASRTWRIFLGREISDLAWLAEPESGS